MKLTILGGGSEVGASCLLLTIDGTDILVDCGVKCSGSGGLPCFSLLEGHSPAAIVLTHAHLDHSGALPIVKPSFPGAPVFMTPPTLDLVSILLQDSLKIMNSASEREGEIPLYTDSAVAAVLSDAFPVGFGNTVAIPGTDVKFTFYPAGHILGAAIVVFEGNEGSAVVTGDFSMQDQITVPGVRRPPGRRRVVITESTYGNRLHADRRIEERKLAEKITSVVTSGGKVLIPAFALGRAQEVIMALSMAMERGGEKFPVFVDGMVLKVCNAYSDHPNYLSPVMARKVRKFGNPFFKIHDNIRSVSSPKERERIADGPPCCVISSSGMLTGGPSQFYAARFAESDKNMIAITGYQDEESPGRQLLDLADGTGSTIVLDGRQVSVRCAVEKYNLSAHADSTEIAGFVHAFRPSEVVLVHGDLKARSALADSLTAMRCGRIYLPENGDEIDLGQGSSRRRSASASLQERPVWARETGSGGTGEENPVPRGGICSGPFERPGAAELHALVIERYGSGKSLTVLELRNLWHGHSGTVSDRELADFGEVLAESGLFQRSHKYSFVFRALPGSSESGCENAAGSGSRTGRGGVDVLSVVDDMLPPVARVLKRGLDHVAKEVTISFAFPLVAAEKWLPIVEEALQGSGWGVRANGSTNVGELKLELDRILAEENCPGLDAAVKVSVFNERSCIQVKAPAVPDRQTVARVRSRFMETTGFDLEFSRSSLAVASPGRRFSGSKMEINAAFSLVSEVFSSSPSPPYKNRRKVDREGEYIELAFITPEIGHVQSALIDRFSGTTGWRTVVSPVANQDALKNLAKTVVAGHAALKREPSFLPLEKIVRIKVEAFPDGSILDAICEEFYERTMYRLDLTL